MTKLVELAIEKLRSLPESRQDAFAKFLIYELDSDAAWERTTEEHDLKADEIVRDILARDARGETELLDLDRL